MYGRYHVWITVIILISPKSLFLFCKKIRPSIGPPILESSRLPEFCCVWGWRFWQQVLLDSFERLYCQCKVNPICWWIWWFHIHVHSVAGHNRDLFLLPFVKFGFFLLTFNESNQSKIEWIIIATTSNKTCLADIWYWYPLLYPFNTQWVWV